MVDHEVLPECVDRLAQIETEIKNIKTNDLKHIEDAVRGIRDDLKATQKFIIGTGATLGLGIISLIIKLFLL